VAVEGMAVALEEVAVEGLAVADEERAVAVGKSGCSSC
jgi:hypothetical protein